MRRCPAVIRSSLLAPQRGDAGHRVQAFRAAESWRRRNSFPPSISIIHGSHRLASQSVGWRTLTKSILTALEQECGAVLR